MTFKIDFKIFLFVFLLLLMKRIELYAIIMLFCILHELGHLIAGRLLGFKIEKMQIMPLGFSISYKLQVDDYNIKIIKANLLEVKKIIIACAGPFVNFIFLVFIYIYLKRNISPFMQNAFYANILILIFNLLPIFPLDGGRILMGILHIIFGKKKALYYSNFLSNAFLIIFLIICSFLVLFLRNIAIFFIAVFLTVMVVEENRRFEYKKKIYKIIDSLNN